MQVTFWDSTSPSVRHELPVELAGVIPAGHDAEALYE